MLIAQPQSIYVPTLIQDTSWSASDASDWVDSPNFTLGCIDEDLPWSPTIRSSTPKKRVELTPNVTPSFKPPKKLKFDASSAVVHEIDGWQLSKVMDLTGCKAECARNVHSLSEYDVLMAHSSFQSKSMQQQREWIHEYFTTHCPFADDGAQDVKNISYVISGKPVCKPIWQATLSLTTTRLYSLRKTFQEGRSPEDKSSRKLSGKSMAAIAWMSVYFDRVGDKRPDKNGIYLPTCLTETMIYSMMVKDLSEDTICFSQFNKLFRSHFSHVTIPKVTMSDVV